MQEAMAPVEIYTRNYCYYCESAKELLNRKGISFTEIDITGRPERRAEMVNRATGRTTVPQIFIGATHVGGRDDLYALEAAGRLEHLFAAGAFSGPQEGATGIQSGAGEKRTSQEHAA